MKKIIISLLLISCVGCFSAGTATVVSTATTVVPFVINPTVQGTVTWKNGEGRKYYNFDKQVVYTAAKNTLQKMNMTITSDSKTLIKAGTKDKFKIAIEESQKNITRVTVRVNFWGDKEYADLFFQCLDDQLTIVHFKNEYNH